MKEISCSKECTGCAACVNICPKKAITMTVNAQGFLYPEINQSQCIECGLCKKECPTNKDIVKKSYLSCYASYSLNPEVREKSSSGGVFTEFAKQILLQNGFVVGAAFDNNKLKHIIIDKTEEIKKIRGSKYLQSEIGDIYEKVKKLLEDNKLVLFSGTPCQINGLKSYLQKEYENLYTIDVFCHGVPSPLVFKKYMEEMKYIPDTPINFRDKTFGWNNYNFLFQTNDGTISSLNDTDTYLRGFVQNLYLRESCYNCKYNALENRNADISIGDFWGVETHYPDLTDNKGVSAIITYTLKGQALLNEISAGLYLKTVEIEQIVAGNPILVSPVTKHPSKNIFFKDFNNSGAIKTIEDLLNINKNVAILNHSFSHDNYGALMVAYSMEKIVRQLGYYPKTIQIKIDGHSILDDFKEKFLHFTEPYKLFDDLSGLNKKYKTFIVGSDQVWRNWWNNDEIMNNFFLSFADKTKNLIAYAASFGIDKFEGSKKLKSQIKQLLKSYSAISVREEEGVDICKNDFCAEAKLVLDPTQLIDVKEYEKIIASESLPKEEGKYLAYMIFPGEDFDTKETRELIQNVSEKLNLKTNFAIKEGNTVAKWLNTFKNADFVVTDSFHGMMFSIIFKKQFICLVNKLGGATRFIHIAEKLGISDRIFYNICDIDVEKVINNKINYDLVDEKLAILRNYSINFLQKALSVNVVDNGRRKFILKEFLRNLIIRVVDKTNKKKIYLFYFVPLLKIKYKANKIKYYLFHFIPVFKRKCAK